MRTKKLLEVNESVNLVFQPLTILIVDDRPENLLTLESIIEKEGRRIIKASHGNEALKIAIKEHIGLIMLDIQMPDIDGIEVARLLRTNNKTRHIPIIFVSAISSNEKLPVKEFGEGTIDYLHKPLDVEQTRNKVAFQESMYHLRNKCEILKSGAEKSKNELDQFVYIISHDLKAPMRAIENLSTWISADISENSEKNALENLMLLKNRVGRMRMLLDGILEYSRAGNLADPPVNIQLSQMAHAVYEAILPPKGFSFHADNLPAVCIQETRIYKIFHHLFSNCINHHDQPGKGEIMVEAVASADQYIIKVTDNGPGIKPQYAEKVFNILCTLNSNEGHESAGVGLPITRKLLAEIGQSVWIEQNSGTGTTVCFTLSK